MNTAAVSGATPRSERALPVQENAGESGVAARIDPIVSGGAVRPAARAQSVENTR